MDMAKASDKSLMARAQAIECQIRSSQSATRGLEQEAWEIREELRRRGMSNGLRDALALIPKIVASPFHQDFSRAFIEHVASALGPDASATDILAKARLPESDFLAWSGSLPSDSQDRAWFRELIEMQPNDPFIEIHRKSFARMAQLL